MNVDEELLDSRLEIEEKRGQTLKVLCILSWVWIGISVLMTLYGAAEGKKSDADMIEERIELLSTIPDGPGAEMSQGIIEQSLELSARSNEYFYEMLLQNALVLVLGFFSVWMMFKLKKVGYYLYIVYSIAPILAAGWLMGFSSMFGIMTVGFMSVISIVFLILYGGQLKRMS